MWPSVGLGAQLTWRESGGHTAKLSGCTSVTVTGGDTSEKQERVNDGEGQKRKLSVDMVEHDHQLQLRHDEKMAK